jgi:hypothetical protein
MDEDSGVEELAGRLEDRVSPAFIALAQGLRVQADGLGAVQAAVGGFGGFTKQYEQIERVSATMATTGRCCCTHSYARTGR